MIERRVIDHDHVVDSKKSKYGSEFKLKVISLDELPEFIKVNWKKIRRIFRFKTLILVILNLIKILEI